MLIVEYVERNYLSRERWDLQNRKWKDNILYQEVYIIFCDYLRIYNKQSAMQLYAAEGHAEINDRKT